MHSLVAFGHEGWIQERKEMDTVARYLCGTAGSQMYSIVGFC